VKFLILILGVLGLGVLALPLLVVAVVATHPWLAVGALTAPVDVVAPPAAPAGRSGRNWVCSRCLGGRSGSGVAGRGIRALQIRLTPTIRRRGRSGTVAPTGGHGVGGSRAAMRGDQPAADSGFCQGNWQASED
jgi:hypothetical protein